MCGRARCTVRPECISRSLGTSSSTWQDGTRYTPSYNALPGSYLPVVYSSKATKSSSGSQPCSQREPGKRKRGGRTEEGSSETKRDVAGEGKKIEHKKYFESKQVSGVECSGDVEESGVVVHVMKWGLVPSFTNRAEKPDHFRMFNARAESLHEKASFRRLLPFRRCVFPMGGFYEWKKETGKKQPYYIHLKAEEGEKEEQERVMLVAGLYDTWKDSEGNILHTFTIITTAASPRFSWLHDRMPAILPSKEAARLWLDPGTPVAAAQKLCQPYNGDDLVWHAVSTQMGRPSFQGAECIAPLPVIPEKKASSSEVATMFRKKEKQREERNAPIERETTAATTHGSPASVVDLAHSGSVVVPGEVVGHERNATPAPASETECGSEGGPSVHLPGNFTPGSPEDDARDLPEVKRRRGGEANSTLEAKIMANKPGETGVSDDKHGVEESQVTPHSTLPSADRKHKVEESEGEPVEVSSEVSIEGNQGGEHFCGIKLQVKSSNKTSVGYTQDEDDGQVEDASEESLASEKVKPLLQHKHVTLGTPQVPQGKSWAVKKKPTKSPGKLRQSKLAFQPSAAGPPKESKRQTSVRSFFTKA